jgi:hypothetical protein
LGRRGRRGSRRRDEGAVERGSRVAEVVDGADELDGERLGAERRQPLELLVEAVLLGARLREKAVRDRPAPEERECRQLPLQRRGQAPHRAYPRMLKRMVLGLGQDVEALHRLEQRRVRERDVLGGGGVGVEADQTISCSARKLIRAATRD